MPPVAEQHGFGDEGMRAQHGFDRLRRDLLAAGGDEQLLLAIGDPQVAVLVDRPMSPVWNQPSLSASAVSSGLL